MNGTLGDPRLPNPQILNQSDVFVLSSGSLVTSWVLKLGSAKASGGILTYPGVGVRRQNGRSGQAARNSTQPRHLSAIGRADMS